MLNVGVVPTCGERARDGGVIRIMRCQHVHTQQVPYDEHPPCLQYASGMGRQRTAEAFFFFAVELKFQSCGGRRNVCVTRIGFANEKFIGVVFASGAPAQPAR
ncbi:hypothetical protein SCLCIDRAFT_806224 [Scleroderma citrinum Foug A]|uniref:Uncharacterized protein n=1 Tax=Scleroderma citrinum Foug A TaxID=1036808 RepID=A0A0C3E3C5_9AGAM|nr:hypothetical protein SCLCIDRAFT_806224 [Scleroderma citrinum Foug A]